MDEEKVMHKVTTLKDGYDVKYYPSTYAQVVKRQFVDESVEASLQRLEYFNNTIHNQDPNKPHHLIGFDPVSLELRMTNITTTLDTDGASILENGLFSASSDGSIIGSALILYGLSYGAGNILTIDQYGQVKNQTVAQLMEELQAAPLESPAFTGIPTAPTPALNAPGDQIVNVEYVTSVLELASRDWGWIKIAVDGWSTELDAQNYYTQVVYIEGMKADYNPIFNLIVSNYQLEAAEKEGFYNLGGITIYDECIIVRTQIKPTVDLFLRVKGV